MTDTPMHPGRYVRDLVIPAGMNVTKAAAQLEVSRPTLSKFLNGKAALSSGMAARLEAAFGVSARKLLDVQTAWDAVKSRRSSAMLAIKSYVPPFLQIRASRIEEWGTTGITPRQRLSVFLRTLVNSTAVDVNKSDFPGNDNSEREGWDGEVIAGKGTAWVPDGHSGWEFGVTKEVKNKADGDFTKSVKATPENERRKITFVFVTPRTWLGKAEWVRARQREKLWKDVRVYDASDLEQWLEQSIAGQTWFANETGQDAQGAISLDHAERVWGADCEPPLAPAIFTDAVNSAKATIKRALDADQCQPTVIVADSKDEGLAFLSAAFAPDDSELGAYRDRVIVFREPGALSKLATHVTSFIPVILSGEVEKEFAPFRSSMPSFIIYPRNATNGKHDIELETLNWESFNKALEAMGLDKDRIDQLARESGRSPTVLRRRLSRLAAIRTPEWASDPVTAAGLIPFVLAGAWKADNKTDQAMLEILAGDVAFEELERRIMQLLPLDSAPIWLAGAYRGVVSKMDALFAIHLSITTVDLKRFFDVAALVLAETDPALELPERDQWAAAIYGRTREISGALREGLAETLVLMAIHGPALFKRRLNFDAAAHADRLVRELLTPLSAKRLLSQIDNLPLYSEAAPETFLSIVEADLRNEAPVTMELMRPSTGFPFGTSPRTGLLWALENLAWSDELFLRTVLVLGRLAERAIDDNLLNKPSRSLSSIFRSWMPQTSAKLEYRQQALKILTEKNADVAWQICVEQFSHHSSIGQYSHKPRWRLDGHGKGSPLTYDEHNAFIFFAYRLALDWRVHSLATLGDLINNLFGMSEELQDEVWDVVDRWIASASEEEKAELRERIRTSALTRRAQRRDAECAAARMMARAKETFERLRPTDPVLRHGWLFRQSWIEESADDVNGGAYDHRARDVRISKLRLEAVQEIFASGGVDAVLRLAKRGQAAYNVGWFLAEALYDHATQVKALVEIANGGDLAGARGQVMEGALLKAGNGSDTILRTVASSIAPEKITQLVLRAPFNQKTWLFVDGLDEKCRATYWNCADPRRSLDPGELREAVQRLISAQRPRAAFQLSQLDLKELPVPLLYSLLAAIITNSSEVANTYILERYSLREAFKILNDSGEITTDQMASLEFRFIDIFSRHESVPLNLSRAMAAQPEFFVKAVVFFAKRKDDQEDPSELRLDDNEARNARSTAAYRLLEAVEFIPGALDGDIDSTRIVSWIERVQISLSALARRDIGDHIIGKILAKAPAAEDKIWPCLPIRDALEQVINQHMERGIYFGLRSACGADWRGEGGAQERELAAKYRGWAEAMAYTHPRVAAMLFGVEKAYLSEADWGDNDAKIARRIEN
jgi:addiction module HigA family antidote